MLEATKLTVEVKNIETPDERHAFEHGSLNVVNLPGVTVARTVFQPGWKRFTGRALAGHVGRWPCGVEFRVASDDQLGHLVAAIREHASGSDGHELTPSRCSPR